MKVFISAPFERWREAQSAQQGLILEGFECTSTWIEKAQCLGPDDFSKFTRAELHGHCKENRAEIAEADICLAMTYKGEGGEMFAEIEAARERGAYVVWYGERKTLSAWHPHVMIAGTFVQAIAAILNHRDQCEAMIKTGQWEPTYTKP